MTCLEPDPRVALTPTEKSPCGAFDMALKTLGRPKDLEKREAILDAAQSLFAERGIDGVAMETIAARSGVSKVTVYGHFGDKATLFESLVERETARLGQALCTAPKEDGGLDDVLIRFGLALIGMLTQPCHLALDRAVSLEAQRNPSLGRRFFEAGPGQIRRQLSDIIAHAQRKGVIAVDDPVCAAEDLLALWLGFDALERRFCGGCTPDEAQLTAHVSRSVRLFLKAYAPA